MVFVVAGPGQCNHHSTVEGQHHGTETPAMPSTLIRKALKLACQVEGGEAKTGERNWQAEKRAEKETEEKLVMSEH